MGKEEEFMDTTQLSAGIFAALFLAIFHTKIFSWRKERLYVENLEELEYLETLIDKSQEDLGCLLEDLKKKKILGGDKVLRRTIKYRHVLRQYRRQAKNLHKTNEFREIQTMLVVKKMTARRVRRLERIQEKLSNFM